MVSTKKDIIPASDNIDDALLDKPEEEEAHDDAEGSTNDRTLLFAFGGMVVVGLLNNVLRVLQFAPMHSYALSVNILTTFIYLPVSFSIVWWRWNDLTDEEKAIPWYKWAIMGCLDGTAGIMQSLGVAFVLNGTLTVLLLQAAIPASMVITRLLTPKRYKPFNYVGAFLVVGGICVVLLPRVLGDGSSGSSDSSSLLLWSMVLVVSCVPMALSSVYKELALGDTDCDVWHMNGQVALYQLVANFALIYPSGIAEGIEPDVLWTNFGNGFRCLAGLNSLPTDDCSSAPYLVTLYCLANLGYNVLIIVLLKLGGSNLLWLCLTLVVPLASMTFTLPFIPAANKGTIDVWTILGLVVIMSGLAVYRFWKRVRPFLGGCGGCMAWFSGDDEDDKVGEGGKKSEKTGDYVALDFEDGDSGLSLNSDGVGAKSPGFASTPGRGADAVHVPRRKRKHQQRS